MSPERYIHAINLIHPHTSKRWTFKCLTFQLFQIVIFVSFTVQLYSFPRFIMARLDFLQNAHRIQILPGDYSVDLLSAKGQQEYILKERRYLVSKLECHNTTNRIILMCYNSSCSVFLLPPCLDWFFCNIQIILDIAYKKYKSIFFIN